MEIKPIATIHTDFPGKFGIPRQSGLAATVGKIIFSEEYRRTEAVRGLESYSHIWLIWQFSESLREGWSPTVRPPRLGGNKRVGVFATRSPFRPNELGLSSVKLLSIDCEDALAPVIYIEGADLMDGTPIYDIKPYLAYTDSHPEAVCGFADERLSYRLSVDIPENFKKNISEKSLRQLIDILENDPRPAYQENPDRIYKMTCLGMDIEFIVNENTLTVTSIRGCLNK